MWPTWQAATLEDASAAPEMTEEPVVGKRSVPVHAAFLCDESTWFLTGYDCGERSASAGACFWMFLEAVWFQRWQLIPRQANNGKPLITMIWCFELFWYVLIVGFGSCWFLPMLPIMWPILTGCDLGGKWQRSSWDDRGACGQTIFCSSGFNMLQLVTASHSWSQWNDHCDLMFKQFVICKSFNIQCKLSARLLACVMRPGGAQLTRILERQNYH